MDITIQNKKREYIQFDHMNKTPLRQARETAQTQVLWKCK